MSNTFTPPIVPDRPPILPSSYGPARALFRFFPNRARYVNVFKLSDGTYVQDTPTAENSADTIPYPWDPNNPSGPYAVATYYDYAAGRMVTENIVNDPYILFVYQGVTTVSSSEAAALTAAGYGDCLT